MMIFPAIDLRGGHCVRLYKGDFSKEEIAEIYHNYNAAKTGIEADVNVSINCS